ncbi:MAG: hydrogenase nickel incorporation protein HypB [Candidatus Riflebacteria bacterium]|nr:hydrogenase nickel incorporation protein HypB [Candidatus Riflebacteria bacterium]
MCKDCGCSENTGFEIHQINRGNNNTASENNQNSKSKSGNDPQISSSTHSHAHLHSHEHSHQHENEHQHNHNHETGQEHNHENSHEENHDHEHSHEHNHEHIHEHYHNDEHEQGHNHVHNAQDLHSHDPSHETGDSRSVKINVNVLEKNDRHAERNRGFLKAKKIFCLNVLSSPGSGKTTIIDRTLADMANVNEFAVIVGDLYTQNDSLRLARHDIPLIQVNTLSICHLDAEMIEKALESMPLDDVNTLIIENVGNLVCPGVYDLGESARVAVLSVTEGEDKPLKYPLLFRTADCVLINKIDIAQAVDFQRQKALENLSQICPNAEIVEVSAKTGEGMDKWYDFIKRQSPQGK